MAKPDSIELGEVRDPIRMPILYEDRSVLAIDKPAGWMLVPFAWQRTQRNLQAAISSSIAAGDFWARSRNLKLLRHVHRLDADTTGILLFAKSMGGVQTYSDLFESRQMQKTYLAVVHGTPRQSEWVCQAMLGPDPNQIGRICVAKKNGKEAETAFRLLATAGKFSLVEASPVTGRTHQIRVHLLESGYPVAGDDLYGPDAKIPQRSSDRHRARFPLGLRAVHLSYHDPFLRRVIRIRANSDEFKRAFGFEVSKSPVAPAAPAAAVPAPAKPPASAKPPAGGAAQVRKP